MSAARAVRPRSPKPSPTGTVDTRGPGRGYGTKVPPVRLPKVIAVANPLRPVPSDAGYLADVVRSVDWPVVLVGHSYGGSVISDVPADAGDIMGFL
jgi:pimeloyl-ACP methyl ester carboxylesterase